MHMVTIEETLVRVQKSTFSARFHLTKYEILFMSYAHSNEDIEKTIAAATKAMEAAAKW